MTHRILAAALVLGLALGGGAQAQEAKQLRIVKQPGLGYLQLVVMRELKLLDKRAPGVDVEWRQLTSGPVIRDAMVAGQMDIGSGGVGPFIQAIDRGVDWKTLGALNEMPLYLNCARDDIKSLKDVKPNDRIAMPAIGSIQHVALQMAAEKELGDAKKLNQQIVAMSHPDATAAILSKREITCHLSSPPFRYEQLRDKGIHKVLDALREATDFVVQRPAEAARLYATSEKSKSSADEILAIMKQDGIKYTMTPAGPLTFAAFMSKIGMIKAVPASWRDYAFEHLHGLPGN